MLAAVDVLGAWTANGARIDLKEEGGKVVGRLSTPGGPCPLPAGAELLRGTLLEDSLSAQVRLCLVSARCGGAEETALAVFLVTQSLTGGVHTRAPCAREVRALVLHRLDAPMAMTAPRSAERVSKTPPARSPRALPAQAAAPTEISSETKLNLALGDVAPAAAGQPAAEQKPGASREEKPAAPQAQKSAASPDDEAGKLVAQGAALLHEGKLERARQAFRDALSRDPGRAEAYNGVGVTYYAHGDLADALAWYKRALEADPRFGDAFYNMACVYALQGKSELAFRYLRLAALNHYAERELMEKDPDLASLRRDPQFREILDQIDAAPAPHP